MKPFEQDSIGRKLADGGQHPWLETLLICALGCVIGIIIAPDDPLFVGPDQFPWSVFAPVMLGLRYGFSQAFVMACALHVFALGYAQFQPSAPWPLPFAYSVGLLLIAMIAGEFRDIWQQRIDRLERSNEYRQARLEEFTRSYHVLKASHDQLEQQNAGSQRSLRSALLSVRELLLVERNASSEPDADPDADVTNLGPVHRLRFGTALLDLLHTHCAVQSATLYQINAGIGGRDASLGRALASIGQAPELAPSDTLVEHALLHRTTASLDASTPEGLAKIGAKHCVVCIPLADTYGFIHAVVAVHDIPFFAYTHDNLQLMTIIAGQVADFQTAALQLSDADLGGVDRDAEYQFVLQALRCLENATRFDLPSSLLCLQFDNQAMAPAYIETIGNEIRGLDLALPVSAAGQRWLLILMPLTGRAGLDQFMVRFNGYLQRRHDVGIEAAGIDIAQHLLTEQSDPAAFRALLGRYVSFETGRRMGLPPTAGDPDDLRAAS